MTTNFQIQGLEDAAGTRNADHTPSCQSVADSRHVNIHRRRAIMFANKHDVKTSTYTGVDKYTALPVLVRYAVSASLHALRCKLLSLRSGQPRLASMRRPAAAVIAPRPDEASALSPAFGVAECDGNWA